MCVKGCIHREKIWKQTTIFCNIPFRGRSFSWAVCSSSVGTPKIKHWLGNIDQNRRFIACWSRRLGWKEEEFVLKDEKLALAIDTCIDKVSKPQGMTVSFTDKRLPFLGLLCLYLWWPTLLLLINIFDHKQVIHTKYI